MRNCQNDCIAVLDGLHRRKFDAIQAFCLVGIRIVVCHLRRDAVLL